MDPQVPAYALLVEDDDDVRSAATQSLRIADFSVTSVASAEQAMLRITPDYPGIIITDVRLPGCDGLMLMRDVHRHDRELPVILVTGHGDVEMAVEAMRDGAWDFIEKPFAAERLVEAARRAYAQRRLVLENRRLKAVLAEQAARPLLGQTSTMLRVRTLIDTLGTAQVDVLIEGETGTGKEVVARALHEASGARGPFVAINCAALPETVFESEIFGAEAGAFTGATRRRIGKLEFAGHGTVFLDEIESMPLPLQVKMLRVLQERAVERLGANTVVPLHCRMVAATKVDLRALASEGRFRDDLYYRLNVATIALPALRERAQDIPLLFTYFTQKVAARLGRPVPPWGAEQMIEWSSRPWLGNVRELRNLAERWVLGLEASSAHVDSAENCGLNARLEAFERSLIEDALTESQGSVTRAAEALQLPRKTLHDRIRRLGLSVSTDDQREKPLS